MAQAAQGALAWKGGVFGKFDSNFNILAFQTARFML
jgi:hypothetical protein